MPFKDLLKHKEKRNEDVTNNSEKFHPDKPEFTFMRTTTTSQEMIEPPSYAADEPKKTSPRSNRFSFRGHSHSHEPQVPTMSNVPDTIKAERRLSERFHLTRSRGGSTSSANVPMDLPDIAKDASAGEDGEAQWENRATLLAKGNSIRRASVGNSDQNPNNHNANSGRRSPSINNAEGDENIHEAIRLHEAGKLEQSTAMFGRLANPDGANNALSQVLYGLALRHGWGCEPNAARAVEYLSYAASNSADVESLALQAGMKKGGAAKGELVLAIFELANCFRHGWGVQQDPLAAKQYYETAANLGDTDAMNEVAWCYVEGFGCKKDKFKAAQYLRQAEGKGSKVLGNSWIWKDKYNPKT